MQKYKILETISQLNQWKFAIHSRRQLLNVSSAGRACCDHN